MTNMEEMYQHILDLEDDIRHMSDELTYFESFLSWMDLWDDFIYFRTCSHPEQDEEDPFPRYVL